MMDRFIYEARLLGWRMVAPPAAIAVGVALLAIAIRTLTQHSASLSGLFTACLEMLLPLAAGVGAASLPTMDASLELQLALPAGFAGVIMRRYALLVAWTGFVAWAVATGIYGPRLWHIPTQVHAWAAMQLYLAEQLVWLGPLLWLAAVGLLLTLLTKSAVASSAILGGVWILETFGVNWFVNAWLHPFFLFPTTFTPIADFWLANRLELIAVGLALLPICWLSLRNLESLLRAAIAERSS